MRIKRKYYLPHHATMAEKKLMESQAIEDLSKVLVRAIKPVGSTKQHAVFVFDLAIFDMDYLIKALGVVHAKTLVSAMKREEARMLRPKTMRTGDSHNDL